MKFELTPISERVQKEKEKDAPEGMYKKYLEGFQLTTEELRGKRVIDVGCGDQALFVQQALKEGIDVTGVDIQIDEALLSDEELQSHVVRSDIRSVAIRDVDYVLAYAALNHSKMDNVLQHLIDMLKPGGEIRMYPYVFRSFIEGTEWQKSQEKIERALKKCDDQIDVYYSNNEKISGDVVLVTLIIRKKEKKVRL